MTDPAINGRAPERPTKGIAIVPHEIVIADSFEFELTLRDPGTVRLLTFALKENRLIPKKTTEVPFVFVESDPEAIARPRRFALLPSGYVLRPAVGYRPRWRASTISVNTGQIGHLFELELDPAALAAGALVVFDAEKPGAA